MINKKSCRFSFHEGPHVKYWMIALSKFQCMTLSDGKQLTKKGAIILTEVHSKYIYGRKLRQKHIFIIHLHNTISIYTYSRWLVMITIPNEWARIHNSYMAGTDCDQYTYILESKIQIQSLRTVIKLILPKCYYTPSIHRFLSMAAVYDSAIWACNYRNR